MPKGWVWTTLPELCTIPITDGTHKTPTYTDKEHGVPFISSKDVTSQRINWNNIKYITRELHEELHKRIAPQKNDILLAKNGTTGVAAIVEDTRVFDIYVTLAVIRPSQNICPQYLYQVINSNFCKEQFNSRLTGIGLPNLHLVDIKKTMIPLPPISEQKRIVTEIERWFVWIEQIRQSKTDLQDVIKQTKSKILDLAIHGKLVPQDPSDEPASELLKHINPKAEITCDNAHSRKLPNGWSKCHLKDVLLIIMGQSPNGETINQINGIEFHQGKLYFSDIFVQSSNVYTSEPTKMAEKDSILLCVRAPVGIVNIVTRSVCIGRGLCALKPKKGNSKFYFYWLQTLQNIFERKATGTTFKAISSETVKNECIALPPLAEQQRIVQKIDELFSTLDNIQKALEV